MATAEGPARAHGEFFGDRPALGKTPNQLTPPQIATVGGDHFRAG